MSEIWPAGPEPAADEPMTGEGAPARTDSDGPVTLFGDELSWRTVSPKLRTIRLTVLAISMAPLLVASALLSVLVTSWVWIAVAALLAIAIWSAWVIHRQVSAISWVELPEELVIRKGRLFRTLVSLPYGRLQYVDVQSGPLMRAHGLASCEFHTASPQSGGSLPGLTTAEAEDLRARLAARGEVQRAGL